MEPQTGTKDYSRLPRNCQFNHEVAFDQNGLGSKAYHDMVNAIAIGDLFTEAMSQDPTQFKLYIVCFMEKDECKSEKTFIPVVGLVPVKYYDQNYLENQPNFSKVQIWDR